MTLGGIVLHVFIWASSAGISKLQDLGLRIAPPEAPVTGYMFGKGVYFADMFSKSANYCCLSTTATSGVLLLCEVALGDMAELQAANYEADKLPVGKLSTKGVGGTAPDLSESLTLEDGVVVPLGRPKEQPGPKGSLVYNEYIVYNVEQIRMRCREGFWGRVDKNQESVERLEYSVVGANAMWTPPPFFRAEQPLDPVLAVYRTSLSGGATSSSSSIPELMEGPARSGRICCLIYGLVSVLILISFLLRRRLTSALSSEPPQLKPLPIIELSDFAEEREEAPPPAVGARGR